MFKDIIQVSEQAYLIDFGTEISIELNSKVILFTEAIFEDLKKVKDLDITNCVPSYNKILIEFSLLNTKKDKVLEYLKTIKIKSKLTKDSQKIIEIPICYEDKYSLDLIKISKLIKLSTKEIINEHLNTLFHVYMIGFIPGLPFMGDLDKKLYIPRKLSPRIKVPKGSVGIVNKLCVIYPQETPGGWNIIGRTPIDLFFKKKKEPLLIKPGNKLRFKRISKKEFENYGK